VNSGILKEFVIQFSGLKDGVYDYSFRIGKSFFDQFDYAEIRDGDVTVFCSLERQTRMLIFQFTFSGTVKVTCDRCADEFDQEVSGDEQLIMKFGDEYHEETENVLVIPEREHQIDVSHFIYEYISLSVPFKRVHGTDDKGNSLCNPQSLKILESLKTEHPSDPRWDVLKNLGNKLDLENK
jgi:uncharacterized protein